jgi:hypothetical protein
MKGREMEIGGREASGTSCFKIAPWVRMKAEHKTAHQHHTR